MSRGFPSDLPVARVPNANASGNIQSCIHCGKDLLIRRWDAWNGFLVICPHCKKVHGKRWNRKAILWGSFFIHAFSFFFTMRPRKALAALILFAVIWVPGYYIVDREMLPQPIEFVLVVAFLFAPVMINGALIVGHQSLVAKSDGTKKNLLSLLEGVSGYFQ